MSFRDAKSTVEVENLRREFTGKEGTVLALDNVDLNFGEGEVFGVLGLFAFNYAEREREDWEC